MMICTIVNKTTYNFEEKSNYLPDKSLVYLRCFTITAPIKSVRMRTANARRGQKKKKKKDKFSRLKIQKRY